MRWNSPLNYYFMLAFVLLGCGGSSPKTSQLQFDSAHNIALDGVIESGRVITDSEDDTVIKSQILEQLRFAIGHLNTFGGGIELAKVTIEIGEKLPLGNQRFQVTYSARSLVSWPREYQIPNSYMLLLPVAAHDEARNEFFQTFGADELSGKRCLDDYAEKTFTGNFWYYYRPLKASCPIRNGISPLVQKTPIRLALSVQNTSNKFPEYGKVWEDGKLVITVVYGKADYGATTASDYGIAAYSELYDSLLRYFGRPATSSLGFGQRPSIVNNDIRLTFRTPRGLVDVAIFLVDSVTSADESFIQNYQQRTLFSDFVAYGGHSGLGDNIQALVNLGRYQSGQYQVFLLNGCDTFSYTDDKLRNDHLAVNPGSSPDKYVDIITNARPSFFNHMTRAVMRVASGLYHQKETYRQILAGFEGSQRAAVTGEEDNRWPAPF